MSIQLPEMESSIYISPGRRIGGDKKQHKKEESLTIPKAHYLGSYKILLWFSNSKQRIFNFEPLFQKYAKAEYSAWSRPSNFKKYVVDNGNIYWGKNEDVIFPVSFLYRSK